MNSQSDGSFQLKFCDTLTSGADSRRFEANSLMKSCESSNFSPPPRKSRSPSGIATW